MDRRDRVHTGFALDRLELLAVCTIAVGHGLETPLEALGLDDDIDPSVSRGVPRLAVDELAGDGNRSLAERSRRGHRLDGGVVRRCDDIRLPRRAYTIDGHAVRLSQAVMDAIDDGS